ncbi:hypothetical protein CCR90_17160 [Rhodovulum sulfidophilum]|uniref:hypothetical protein n=1 Tax=Rhodovulum sulfidophilum TaxID=35806 RepID=UPI00191294F1|nr:hypothetical protein [Rhodovulum sulfidophilum]MBK5925464.1 hypothetical protein [Rhodovulum sulfidophilum]
MITVAMSQWFLTPEVDHRLLAEADLGVVQAGRGMRRDLFGQFFDAGPGGLQAGDGRQPVTDRPARQIKHPCTEQLALEI